MAYDFRRNMLKGTIAYTLKKRDWEFDYDGEGELYFVLGNREIFTKDMNSEQLNILLDEIFNW